MNLDNTNLEEQEYLYFVGKHVPLSSYPRWARWLVRTVYFLTRYQDSPHTIGIANQENLATSWCLDDGYFYQKFHLNEPLPDEICQLEPTVFPLSKARKRYEQYHPKLIAVKRAKLIDGLENAESGLLRLKTILTTIED